MEPGMEWRPKKTDLDPGRGRECLSDQGAGEFGELRGNLCRSLGEGVSCQDDRAPWEGGRERER